MAPPKMGGVVNTLCARAAAEGWPKVVLRVERGEWASAKQPRRCIPQWLLLWVWRAARVQEEAGQLSRGPPMTALSTCRVTGTRSLLVRVESVALGYGWASERCMSGSPEEAVMVTCRNRDMGMA